MTLMQIISDIKAMQMDETPIDDRAWWIDEGVRQLEEAMNREVYEEVVAQAISKALIYKFNHNRSMPKKMKHKMIIELLQEYGLTN